MMVIVLYWQPDDLARTIGVHTDYIQLTDFNMTNKDKEFMVKVGSLT